MVTHSDIQEFIAVGSDDKNFEFKVSNNYEFSYKQEKLKIELIEEADGFTLLSCNGLRYPVEIVSQKQNAYEIMLNGVCYKFNVETPFSLKRSKIISSMQPVSPYEEIKAPMPGKILNVAIGEGNEIAAGETIMILEAMKMQNSLLAKTTGVIEKVNVKVGDIVAKDDVLALIKC